MSVEKYDVREDHEVWRILGGKMEDLEFAVNTSEWDDSVTWRIDGDAIEIWIPMGTSRTGKKE